MNIKWKLSKILFNLLINEATNKGVKNLFKGEWKEQAINDDEVSLCNRCKIDLWHGHKVIWISPPEEENFIWISINKKG